MADGAIEIGGRLPINTSGGLLSETGMPGLQLVMEGVRQMRGTARLQVPGAAHLPGEQPGRNHAHPFNPSAGELTWSFRSPSPTELTRPFWDALRHGHLVFQTCGCGHAVLPARRSCPACLGPQLTLGARQRQRHPA